MFRGFSTFSRICIFFLLTLSLLSSSLFCSSLLSASAHLCFSSVHIVGSLTSKLPSMIISIYLFVIFLLIWKGMVLFLPSLYCDVGLFLVSKGNGETIWALAKAFLQGRGLFYKICSKVRIQWVYFHDFTIR